MWLQKTHNMTLDSWALEKYGNITIYEKLRLLEAWQFHLLYYNQEMAKLKGGKWWAIRKEKYKDYQGLASCIFYLV